MINAWNDYMKTTLSAAQMDAYMSATYAGSMNETWMPCPAVTVAFGEKLGTSQQFYMDLLEQESNGAVAMICFNWTAAGTAATAPAIPPRAAPIMRLRTAAPVSSNTTAFSGQSISGR